ncbi:MAG TPA: plastocyanin/azurin family copper-binding protein [Gemmataceae bacterium]|nr:plastocyanin/azurin family copper-binding protein [Gemmataceae bacterium]
MRVTGAIVVIGLLVLAAHAALAEEQRVLQKDKRFSKTALSVKTGDLITFVNDDQAMHNVYSYTEGFSFDLGGQSPGEETTVRLSKVGVLDIRCAIHPKMKLQVRVQPR